MKLIYAQTLDGKHSLLRNGKVPVIAKIHPLTKKYSKDGKMEIIKTLEFDFDGNGCSDYFFFVDDVLRFHSISLCSDSFTTEGFRQILEFPRIDFDNFLQATIDTYVLWKMGLIDYN